MQLSAKDAIHNFNNKYFTFKSNLSINDFDKFKILKQFCKYTFLYNFKNT